MKNGKYVLLVLKSGALVVGQYIRPSDGKVIYLDVSRFKNLSSQKSYQFRIKKSRVVKVLKEWSNLKKTIPKKEIKKVLTFISESL